MLRSYSLIYLILVFLPTLGWGIDWISPDPRTHQETRRRIMNACERVTEQSQAGWLDLKSPVFYRFFNRFDPARETVLFFVGGPGATAEKYRNYLHRLSITLDKNVLAFDSQYVGCTMPESYEEYIGQQKIVDPVHTVNLALELIDHFGIAEVTLYGKSYGSLPALMMAKSHSERVVHVVSEGTLSEGIAGTKKDAKELLKVLKDAYLVHGLDVDELLKSEQKDSRIYRNIHLELMEAMTYSYGAFTAKHIADEFYDKQKLPSSDDNYGLGLIEEPAGFYEPDLDLLDARAFYYTETLFTGLCSLRKGSRSLKAYLADHNNPLILIEDDYWACRSAYEFHLKKSQSLRTKEVVIAAWGQPKTYIEVLTDKGPIYYAENGRSLLLPPRRGILATASSKGAPVTFVTGSHDLITPRTFALKVASEFKKAGREARHITIQALGHTALFYLNDLTTDKKSSEELIRSIFSNEELIRTGLQSINSDIQIWVTED